MGHYHDELRSNQQASKELRELIPGTYEGFSAMHKAALTEGELSAGFKELIAIAIAVADECEGCIASHTRAAARLGVSRQELAEMLGVVIMMNGGPGTIYAPKAWAAFTEFEERYA